jgi:ATP synthase protein I
MPTDAQANQPRRMALHITLIQAAVLAVFFIGAWCVSSWPTAYAILMGGLCGLIPAFLYVLFLFARTGAQDAKRIVAVFFGGEFVKLMLSAVLVLVALLVFHLSAGYVLLGFAVTLLAFFVGSFICLAKMK